VPIVWAIVFLAQNLNGRLLKLTVSVDQIRQRLAGVTERRLHFERQATQSNQLKRHEMWRHSYLAWPYLIGAPDERVADRFRHVFLNLNEIGENGQLRPVPFTETDEHMQMFTHMLEEYGARTGGGPPNAVIQSAREPIHKYFEGGTPIGVKLFEGYQAPTTPILVRYGKREFMEPMFKTGELRLANAGLYNNDSHIDAVRDNETLRTFFIPTYKERLVGETYFNFKGRRIELGDDDLMLPLEFEDYYLFSLCSHIHYRMPADFNADAAIVIRDPQRFKQRLISTFLARHPGWIPLAGKVTYFDPYRVTGFKDPEMAKHFAYAYQKEVRIALRRRYPPALNAHPLEPVFLSIGSMSDYADLVTL